MKTFVNYLLILVLTDLAPSSNILNLLPETYAKAKSVSCKFNTNYVTNLTCKLRPINWERSSLNVECDLLQPLQNVTIHLEAFKYTNQFRPFLINTTLNYCKMFDHGGAKNPYLGAALSVVAKFSNLIHKCPFTGHVYIRDAYVDLSRVPFYIPTGTYKLVTKYFGNWPLVQFGMASYIFEVAEINNTTRITYKNKMKNS